jgi:hypothetical protein
MVDAAWSSNHKAANAKISVDHLHQVVEDLTRPAMLVVEDLESDGCFIRAIAAIFGNHHLLNALKNGWLEISHAGGSRLEQVAKQKIQFFHKQIRVVALLDSDSMQPNERTANHSKSERLARLGSQTHVLELREAENYVPNSVIRASMRPKTASKKLNLLKLLTPSQRGHFDMKNGFKTRDGQPVIPPEQQELFSNLDPQTVRGLQGGFGSKLLELLESEKAKLTINDFAKLGVEREMNVLLSTIESVI